MKGTFQLFLIWILIGGVSDSFSQEWAWSSLPKPNESSYRCFVDSVKISRGIYQIQDQICIQNKDPIRWYVGLSAGLLNLPGLEVSARTERGRSGAASFSYIPHGEFQTYQHLGISFDYPLIRLSPAGRFRLNFTLQAGREVRTYQLKGLPVQLEPLQIRNERMYLGVGPGFFFRVGNSSRMIFEMKAPLHLSIPDGKSTPFSAVWNPMIGMKVRVGRAFPVK